MSNKSRPTTPIRGTLSLGPSGLSLSLNAYAIVTRAVEEGVRLGWRRAHKHTDTPEEGAILDAIEQAVLNALSEVVQWP